ncbi:hypothetical protein CISIN_1g0341711mg, partial [Citrus sinensis]
ICWRTRSHFSYFVTRWMDED